MKYTLTANTEIMKQKFIKTYKNVIPLLLMERYERELTELLNEVCYQQRIKCADAFAETFEEHDVYWDIVNAPKPE